MIGNINEDTAFRNFSATDSFMQRIQPVFLGKNFFVSEKAISTAVMAPIGVAVFGTEENLWWYFFQIFPIK